MNMHKTSTTIKTRRERKIGASRVGKEIKRKRQRQREEEAGTPRMVEQKKKRKREVLSISS